MTCYWLDSEFIDDGKTIDLISIGLVAEDGRTYYAQSVEFHHRKASDWVKENVLKQLPTCPWAKAEYKQWGISRRYLGEKTYHAFHHGQCVDQHGGLVHNCPWRSREQIRNEIVSFLDPATYGNPELWAWCGAYDWVLFCQLFGTMMDLPAGYPHYIRDLQYLLDMHGIADHELPQPEGQAHNALNDARYIKNLWEYIEIQRKKGWL